MASENDARSADVQDYYSECGEDWLHYTYFHTETCNGLMHTIICNKPEHHDQMSTLEVCTESCGVYQRENRENAAEVEESGTTQRLLECDTEECNGYMHTVLCTNPAQHDRMASFFLCNDKCEIYQQRKRKLEKRMTTPTVPVPEQYLDPERADVDEVDVPEQDTLPMDEDATSISHDGVPLSEQDTMLIGDDNGSAHASFDPVEVDEGVNWHCTQELQPPKSVKSRRRRVRKNKRKNETVQRRQNRSCKRRILSDGHVVFLFIEEEPQQLTMQNGESQPSA